MSLFDQRRVRMPRGKYRGKFIDELPIDYLKWVAENWGEETPQDKLICETADAEYQFRKASGGTNEQES